MRAVLGLFTRRVRVQPRHLVAVTSPAAGAATRPVAANANALLRELVLD